MYNELIDALQCTRHFALYQDCYERNCYANSGKGLYCNIPKLMADAADAIEHLKENVAHQQDAIERLMAQVPAWISVEERLPENEDEVIVTYKCNYEPYFIVSTDYYNPRARRWELYDQYTHWMPFPQPPEVKQ